MGPDKLKVIENFNLSIMLPQARATKVRKLWSGFSELYKMLSQNKVTGNSFHIKAREWLSIFLTPSRIIPSTNTIISKKNIRNLLKEIADRNLSKELRSTRNLSKDPQSFERFRSAISFERF